MKRIFLLFLSCILSVSAIAQKKNAKADTTNKVDPAPVPVKKYNCDSVVVDFEKGMINGKIGLDSPIDSIKKYLPCVTTEIPLGHDEHLCGGGAILEKPGIFFNLENGFIELTPGRAHLPFNLFGLPEDTIAYVTGEPVEIKDLQPYTDRAVQSVYLFPKSYGCMAVWVNQEDKKVFKIQLHNKTTSKAVLCIE